MHTPMSIADKTRPICRQSNGNSVPSMRPQLVTKNIEMSTVGKVTALAQTFARVQSFFETAKYILIARMLAKATSRQMKQYQKRVYSLKIPMKDLLTNMFPQPASAAIWQMYGTAFGSRSSSKQASKLSIRQRLIASSVKNSGRRSDANFHTQLLTLLRYGLVSIYIV